MFFRRKQSKWHEVLLDCDFELAKREILKAFEIAEDEAKRQGGHNYYHPKLMDALTAFVNDPREETATALLEVVPNLETYFENCKPGGMWKMYDDLLR